MEYRALITEFAARLGIEDVAFDEENVVRIQADDMTFAFMEIPERNVLLTWSKVAAVPPEKLDQLYRLLLEASFMGRATEGATFSLDRGSVYLHRIDSLVDLDAEVLTKIFEGFVNLVEKWKGVIETFRADDSSVDSEAGLSNIGLDGFLQV